MLDGRYIFLLRPILNYSLTLECSTLWSCNHELSLLHISGRTRSSQTHSANFVCKDNDFFWHYVHFTRFSCRICLFLIKIKLYATFTFHFFASIKRKMDGFRHRRFRFKFRCSYIYNKVWKTQIVLYESLLFGFRNSCIYTWVNVNLKLCCLEVLHVIWKIHFSFTE